MKVVHKISEKRKKSVVILTTHSMEEAEALCSRIAVQVDGQFRCLGSAQQIKSLYGQGLELNMRLAPPTYEEVTQWCAKVNSMPQDLVQIPAAMGKLVQAMGQQAAQQLSQRPGCVLTSTYDKITLFQLAEWCLLEVRVMNLEAWLHGELSAEINGQPSLVVLEKNGPSLRYRILAEALMGRWRSLGALFQLLQKNQAQHRMDDFQVSQSTLEQIFNSFASAQMGQAAQAQARTALKEKVNQAMEPDTRDNAGKNALTGSPAENCHIKIEPK